MAMMTSTARVATELPRRYLIQLCRHFDHKLPVTLDETVATDAAGRIEFPFGVCDLAIEPGLLVLRVVAADAEALSRTEDVVARHLVRFAFREPPQISWGP
jgi:hypothetical protein